MTHVEVTIQRGWVAGYAASVSTSCKVPRVNVRLLAALSLSGFFGAGSAFVVRAQVRQRALSVIARDEGTVVLSAPVSGARRRGTLARGTRVPILARVDGPGCNGAWIRVMDFGYVCEADVVASFESPTGIAQPQIQENALLPFRYAFVASDGTAAYSNPQDYVSGEEALSLGKGFGVVVVGRRDYDGTGFARTRRGYYIVESELRFARGSDFRGFDFLAPREGAPMAAPDRINVGWVARAGVTLRKTGGRRFSSRRSQKRDPVIIVSENNGRLQLESGEEISARDIVRPTVVAPPAAVPPNGRWIDIEVATQTLVAYEGTRPVFATLVSTGRAGRETATPLGVHRIWAKVATSDMSNIMEDDAGNYYAIEAVPWVQFFQGSNAIHAAFWHDEFGKRRSHGCVNLSPRDARWIFEFTAPALPDGYTGILPTDSEYVTVIQVR